MDCWKCGKSNLIPAEGNPKVLYDPNIERVHTCSGIKQDEQDYLMCYTHAIKLKDGKCTKSDTKNQCFIFGTRSRYDNYIKIMNQRNNHEHDWYQNGNNEIRCFLCTLRPEDCGIANITKYGIPFLEVDSKQHPLDVFLKTF